jgi:quercetin dioxygenase-like cupin family protein
MSDQAKNVVRRIVTGHDEKNVAKAMIDGPASNARHSNSGITSTLIWCTDSAPATMPIGEEFEDMGARKLGTPPPPKGTRFAVLDFPPGNKPAMHRTESIDYVIVISGEIDMDMDDSTVTLRAGDVMVQRGTNHSWVNRSNAPSRVAFVLVDAEPLGIGHAVSRAGTAS